MNIADNVVIGKRIDDGRVALGMTDKELCEKAGNGEPIPLNNLYRYKKGEIPQGVRDITALGLTVGLTPTRLLLQEPVSEVEKAYREGVYSEKQRGHILRVWDLLAEIVPFIPTLPEHAERTLENIKADLVAADVIPVGSSISAHDDGVTTIEPPPTKEERTRKGGSGKNTRLSDDNYKKQKRGG